MPNGNENPDDIDSPSERESVPADFDCPDVAPIESYDGNIEAPWRFYDDVVGSSHGVDLKDAPLPTCNRWIHCVGPKNHGGSCSDDPWLFESILEANNRAELDGQTEDGLSAIYLTGNYRFVTPCHTAAEGLRASKICAACKGNLDKPVETAIPLVCGHFAVVIHSTGDRVTPCPTCGIPSVVRAEQVITTRYIAREMQHAEQLQFLGLQT